MNKPLYLKKGEYEEKLKEAQDLTNQISNGGIDLYDVSNKAKKDARLIQGLRNTLNHFKTTSAKIETDSDQEVPYNRDKNGKDIKNTVNVNPTNNQFTTKNDSSNKSSEGDSQGSFMQGLNQDSDMPFTESKSSSSDTTKKSISSKRSKQSGSNFSSPTLF